VCAGSAVTNADARDAGNEAPVYPVAWLIADHLRAVAPFAALTLPAAMSAQLKVKKAREFLQKGNRVRVMVAFPGRRGFEDAKRMLATLVEQVNRPDIYGR